MLHQLDISNYALIETLSVNFKQGFSVITGETGAGKSILLGALGFVLGERADTNVLYDKEKKCIVEASFALNDESLRPVFEENELDFDMDCTLRRELSPQKKTRAFINDTPVSLQTLKEIGSLLVDVHSQHDSLLLTDSNFQIHILDEIAKNEESLSLYHSQFTLFNTCRQKLQDLKDMAEKNASEYDFMKFQYEELEKARLKEGEYYEIEQTLSVMENAEEIKTLLVGANTLLENSETAILPQLNDLSSTIGHLENMLPSVNGMKERLESLRIELKDIAYDLDRLEGDTQFDEEQLQKLSERHDLLNRLMMKHHISDFDQLIGLRDGLKEKVTSFENIDQEIEKAEKNMKDSEAELRKLAKKLHESRVKASSNFEKHVTELVKQLAMPHASFKVSVEESGTYNANGSDTIRFLFSANKGIEVNDIEKVASGGELSRLMLSIKSVVSQYNYIPTLIFDEIDTGVSGEVASKIGGIMRQMGESLQLISITHLPQVASKAANHYFIFKDNEGEKTKSNIKVLRPEERVTEIAKMLSNDQITPEAMKAAEVLLH